MAAVIRLIYNRAETVKFGISTLLSVVAIIAVSLPFALRYFQLAIQPNLSVTATAKYTKYEFPHINCISVHDEPWGRIRIVVLHRVTSQLHARGNTYPEWVGSHHASLPLKINGKEIFAADDVKVYYAQDNDPPRLARIELSEIALLDPWWPEPDKLWNLVTETDAESHW